MRRNRGGRLHVDLNIRNDGFAAPYQSQKAQLVLTDGRRTYRLPLRTDVRRWAPGTTTRVAADLRLPHRLPAGRYRLALALPSAFRSLAHDSRYAIRTANLGMWDGRHGWNKLGTSVRVTHRAQ